MLRFKRYLREEHNLVEASLSGKSRSGGMSNWDYYVVPTWKKSDGYIHSLAKATKVYQDPTDTRDPDKQSSHPKGIHLQILSKKLKVIGNSKFAKVKIEGGPDGYVNISAITKPSGKSTEGGVIGGGKNSKEFTPDKMNLGGEEFSSAAALVSTVSKRLNSVYSDAKYKAVKKYLSEFTQLIAGTPLTEGAVQRFTKTYSTKKTFGVTPDDIKILTKNFGEVLGALYIVHTNKKMVVIGFPSDINEGLYDFYGKDKRGRMHYYSVKNAAGSSTSLNNLNFIKKNFSKDNAFVKKHMDELEAIDLLVNYKGRNTVGNIIDFFYNVESAKTKQIIKIMSKPTKLKEISTSALAKWIQAMRKKKKEKDFIDIMQEVYEKVLSDMPGKTPAASVGSLKDMYRQSSKNEYDGGYLIYPLGSYIVSYMNDKTEYKDALNLLADFGNYISQVTVQMDVKNCTIQIIKFSKNEFRFSYNGGSKYPGNRPIGFKEA